MKAKDGKLNIPGWPYPWIPAHRELIEKLCTLAPERANEWWTRWNEGFPKEEALQLIAELTEARKPKMHTANEIAERTLRQSAEQLAVKHKEEWPHAKAERRQAILRFWVEQHRFIETIAQRVR
jgi:hypothetical protein